MRSEVAGRKFRAEQTYLDTATYGLPPHTVVEAMTDGIDQWARGVAKIADFDAALDRSRQLFAGLVNVAADDVAVANQASVLVATVAAGLPDGANVVIPSGEFTSLLFPLLIQADRGVTVTEVPLESLADHLDETVDMVAFSLVQSSDGRLVDVDQVLDETDKYGITTLVDGTQAAGWLPIDAQRFDHVVVAAYKWLLCPRGTAFMTARPQRLPHLRPVNAGWFAGGDVWSSIYGGPLRLAPSARRLDVSPAWLAWTGTRHALELIADVGVATIHEHNLRLATEVRTQLGLPPASSAIVTIPADNAQVLLERGITSAIRAGSVRVGFHLYNDADDVARLIKALRPDGAASGATGGAAPAPA